MRNRAITLSVLIWFGGVLFSTAVAADGDTQILTNIGQIRALSTAAIERQPAVRLEATVTRKVPTRNHLWVQDAYDGLQLVISPTNRFNAVERGDRVRVTGRVAQVEQAIMVSPEEVTVLEKGRLLEAPLRTTWQIVSLADENRWVTTEGHVRQVVTTRRDRWLFDMESGTNRFWLDLPKRTNDDVTALGDATVRARGITVKRAYDDGERLEPTLLIENLSDIAILKPGRTNAAHAPDASQLPVLAIASLTQAWAMTGGALVRVQGALLDQRLGEFVIVADSTGTLFAESRMTTVMNARAAVDLWGTLAWDGSRVYLKDATFVAAAADGPTAGETRPAARKPVQLDLLTKAREVRDLPPEQAAWRYPVRLRGVVTLYLRARRQFFVQDDTAGIFVGVQQSQPNLKPGDWVEIEGTSSPGAFAPTISPTRVTVLGTAPMPEPRTATLYQLATGQFDSQWIEAHGVVRSLTYNAGLSTLKLSDSDGTLFVNIPSDGAPTNLVDTVVRLRGVCASRFNNRRQIVGVAVWTPSLAFLQIEEAGAADPLSLPTQPIVRLNQFRSRETLSRRVKVAGVATAVQSAESFFVQDASDGVQVFVSQTGEVKPGDRVEVSGYPALGEYGGVLRDAVFRVVGHGSVPKPRSLTPGNALDPQLHGLWVEVDARLSRCSTVGDGLLLTLQIPGWFFEARCLAANGEKDVPQAPPVGSLLRLTGVYRIRADETRSPRSFELIVPSNAKVSVLERPSWWTSRHTITALGGMALMVGATTLWVIMLRRKVREQTTSLQQSEMKFRSLVERSLVGVYIIQDGRFAYLNPRMAEIYGYTPEEMIGLPAIREAVFEADWPLVEEQIRRRISGETTTAHYAFRGRRKDGSLPFVEVLDSRAEYQGKPAVVGTLMDITDRKRAEEELFNSRQMLQTVLDTIPQRVFWKDRDLVYVGCNKPLAQDCGFSDPGELTGKTDFETASAATAELYRADDRRVMETGQSRLNYEEPQTSADGSTKWLKTSKVPLYAKDGQVVGVLGTYEDITERKRAEAALAEASSLLATLLENSPDCIYFKDRQSRFVRYSKSFAQLFHLSDPDNLRGKTDFDFFLEEHARSAYEDEQEIIRSGKPLIGKLEKESHSDGRITWALTTKLPWRDKDGNVIGTFGISKDVTAMREAETKLAYERELFQTLLQTIPDHIYFKDRESRFVQVSKSKAEGTLQTVLDNYRHAYPVDGPEQLPAHLTGVQAFAEWLIGKTDFDTYPDGHARASFGHEQEIIRTGQPMVGKLERAALPEGKFIWYLTTKMPWRDTEGNIIGTFGISKDVTVVKEAEDKLAHERELFRTLLDNIPDAIYFKDLQSHFVRVSTAKVERALAFVLDCHRAAHPSAAPSELPSHLAGVGPFAEYLKGRTDFDIYPEARARSAYEDEQKIIRTGQAIIGKPESVTHPTGKVSWVLTTKMPWRDEAGNLIGTFGVSRDISALKEAEAELEATHQRLLETSRLAGMAEVATDVLHNVGNVLNSVNVSCSLALDRVKQSKLSGLSKLSALLEKNRAQLTEFLTRDPQGKGVPDYLAALADYCADEHAILLRELTQLRDNIDHIKQIVSMQQNYAKVAGVVETVEVVPLVEDALRVNSAALQRHGVRVLREFEAVPPIVTEKHKVLQILVNLIRNAKYALHDGNQADRLLTVKIGGDTEGHVKICVVDNGVGIAPENLTRIFAHGFTTRRNGHGFGLHSSALAVRDLGGTLRAHSDGPGKGAVFTLRLPPQPSTPSEPS